MDKTKDSEFATEQIDAGRNIFSEDDHKKMDSNFALGIDMVEPGLMNMIKFNFNTMFK